jgi:hypothetical protein
MIFKRKIHILILVVIALSLFFLPIDSVQALDTGVNAVNNSIELGNDDPREIVGRIINIAMLFLGIIAVGIIIFAGFKWMMAGGEEEKINDAKKLLKNGVIGLVIVLSSWGIASFVLSRLMDATGPGSGSGVSCISGETAECGCDGVRTCVDGSWGLCVGSDCDSGSGVSCDGNTLTPDVCDQDNSICDDSSFCNQECLCEDLGGVGDPCEADSQSEEGVCSQPSDEMCGEYLTCDANTCTCQGSPVITNISPYGGFCEDSVNSPCLQDSDCSGEGDVCNLDTPNGAVGNLISIQGYNFSTSTEVVFLGDINNESDDVLGIDPSQVNENCSGVSSSNLIIVVVPSGANIGPIAVENTDDGLFDDTYNDIGPYIEDFVINNIERPGLCTLNPEAGVLTDEVMYQGLRLTASNAYFGSYDNKSRGLSSNFVESSGTTLVPNIQRGEMTSFVIKDYSGFPVKSNYLNFSKEAEADTGPYITSFSPSSGAPGQYVSIQGSGFGNVRGFSQVLLGNQEVSYDFPSVCQSSVWTDKEVIVKVPENAENGTYAINMQIDEWEINSNEANPNAFTVDSTQDLKPSLCKIEPIRGPTNSPVTVYGEYFGEVSSQAVLRFYYNQNQNAEIQAESDYLYIDAQVPQGASTGPVRVIKDSIAGNSLNFAVEQCEVDDDCGAQICCPTGTYKEGRCTDDGGAANTYANCYAEIPSSLYKWDFSTGWGTSTTTPIDPCADLNETQCAEDIDCCFDAQSGMEGACRTGDEMGTGDYPSYCAYYDCKDGEESYLCDFDNPNPFGEYEDEVTCEDECLITNDPCASLNETECAEDSSCCFDAQAGEDGICTSGDAIGGEGSNAAYCTYFNCMTGENSDMCNILSPDPYGIYPDELTCQSACLGNDDPNYGASCTSVEEDICDTSICGSPFACLTGDGSLGSDGDCGFCCCNANNTNSDPQASDYDVCLDINPALSCLANQTPCEGEDRGLCCGCNADSQCGSDQAGCGLDTCCRNRPQVLADEVSPSHMQSNVCRNTMISVPFDQKMDRSSFNNNILLLAEYDYGNTCPAGTFLANKDLETPKFAWWKKLKTQISRSITPILARLNLNNASRALADWNSMPTENDLYCLVPGTVGFENSPDGNTTLTYSPNTVLDASTIHYVVVKGDEYLDSSVGVKSYEDIGMNGFGYWNINTGNYVEGANIEFNGIRYYNSHIWKFETLSDQGGDPGICKVDYVRTEPDSYLFSTTQNSLEENDSDSSDSTYDTVKDRDKEYQVKAFSIAGQRLARTDIYNWSWNWYIDNTDIVKFANQAFSDLSSYSNKQLVSTAANVSDGQTFVKATVDMSNYTDTNITLDGDGTSNAVPVYVFICDNPWPAPHPITNAWSPWMDASENCSLPGEECQSYNYNFYYCRDAGNAGTSDDLPAIIDDNAVIRGSSKVCSDGSGPCSDDDNCANPEAQCIWDVLKESYFFREAVPNIGTISQVIDLETGGSLKVSWSSDSYLVNNYILYYRENQSQTYDFVEVALDGSSNPDNPNAGQACFQEGDNNVCNYVVNSLEDNKTYYFKVSAITNAGAESPLSNEVSAIPTDKQAPTTPIGLGAENY